MDSLYLNAICMGFMRLAAYNVAICMGFMSLANCDAAICMGLEVVPKQVVIPDLKNPFKEQQQE